MFLLFGGSFDPIHLGHIDLARRALDRYQPKQLWLVPAKKNPLKDFTPGAPAVDRLQMVRLAVAELQRPELRRTKSQGVDSQGVDSHGLQVQGLESRGPQVQVLDWELDRPGPSYTWDTVQRALTVSRGGPIALLIGDEVFQHFGQWHRAQELIQTVDIIVCSRSREHSKVGLERSVAQCGIQDGIWVQSKYPGELRLEHSRSRRWLETLSFDALPVSGTDIRDILSTYRGSVRPPGIPNSVWDYIKKRNLYSVK